MLSPLCETFSVDIDRIAWSAQPTTAHFCPLATLPIETIPRRRGALEKLDFSRLDSRFRRTRINAGVNKAILSTNAGVLPAPGQPI
jgi:hypothetical protein